MELKVICDCGQKIKFDVEPLNGKMPFAVICPVCQADDTAKANELLAAQSVVAASPLSIVTPSVSLASAPTGGGLRINRPAQAEPASVAAVPEPPAGDPPPPAIGALRPFAVATAANPPKKTSFGMGLVGGLVGALVGGTLYFLIFNYTGLRLSVLALGVGALAGWLAELLGKGEGSKELGGITAVLALTGVVGAQYLVALSWGHDLDDGTVKLLFIKLLVTRANIFSLAATAALAFRLCANA